MNDERPIEKLLRRYAKKRRDDSDTSGLEMHPATRRLLQGELARQFPKRAAESAEETATWSQLLKSLRTRLLWALPIVIGLGVGVWILVETNEKPTHEADLAKSTHAPATPAKVVEDSFKALETPATKPPAPASTLAGQPTLAGNIADRDHESSVTSRAPSESSPATALSDEVLRREGSVTMAKAASAIPEKDTGLKFETPSLGVNEPAQLAPVDKSQSKFVAKAAPPSEGQSVAVNEAIQSPGVTYSGRAKSGSAGDIRDRVAYALPAAPPATPATVSATAKAGPYTAENYYHRQVSVAAKRGQIQAYTQTFANRVPVARHAKAAKGGAISPVLVRFEVEQTGNQVRVIDSDGSTYVGQMILPAPTQNAVVAVEKKGAEQLKLQSRVQVAKRQIAAVPLPERQDADNFEFRATGTNRTLNQQVIFTWNYVPLTNALAATQAKAPIGNAQVWQPQLPSQLPLLNNSAINGRAQLDDKKEIQINAVPVSP